MHGNESNGTATRSRKTQVTVDLGEDCLEMLDQLRSRLQAVSLTSMVVTRSAAIREAIICLYQKQLVSADGMKAELPQSDPLNVRKKKPSTTGKPKKATGKGKV